MTREAILKDAKPILFGTDEVRATLDGRKTVKRLVIKPQPKMRLCYTFAGYGHGKWNYPDKNAWKYWGEEFRRPENIEDDERKRMRTPPCHTDDILYVRETFCALPVNEAGHMRGHDIFYYKADGDLRPKGWRGKWCPSIHMPKEAARIFLWVTDVRVERLQEITEGQAQKEGMPDSLDYPISRIYCPVCRGNGFVGGYSSESLGFEEIECIYCNTAVKRFMNLWSSTIKKSDLDRYGWGDNPWVWVIEFERVMADENVN